jgi:hypothetical protein
MKVSVSSAGNIWTNHALVHLLWPLILEQILGVTIGIVDTMMVSSVGEHAVSGVSIVDAINILLINIFASMATGGAVVASQFIGRKDGVSAKGSARSLWGFAQKSYKFAIYCKFIPCKLPSNHRTIEPSNHRTTGSRFAEPR